MKKVSLLGILFLAFFGCRNDIDEMNGGSSTVEPPIIIQDYDPDSELVTGTVFGRVYDEQENPVANALVKHDGQNYSTDEEGRFFIIEETMDKQGTFLTVEADGFFNGSRRFNPQDSSVNYVYVQLLALNEIGTFEAASGAELSGSDGLGISFPPNSIQSASGALYDGQVSVAAKWLDPTADNIGEIMPGNLLGLNVQIEEVALVSYGMAAVELFGDNGEKLNITEGQTATLSIPVPQELLNSAPATIPLWSFEDEQFGIWAEEGSATLQNGMYVGEVSHFSFWNCDVPFPLVFVEGQITTRDGTPLANAAITITPSGQTYGRWGTTNNEGYFAGKMPRGEELTLSIGYLNGECEFNDIILGVFDTDTNIGRITLLNSVEEFTVFASFVDCYSNPVTNGLVKITFGSRTHELFFTEDNTISISLPNCNSSTELTIEVFDITSLMSNNVITRTIQETVNFNEIVVCDNPIEEFFTISFSGGPDRTTFEGFIYSPQSAESLRIQVLTGSIAIGNGIDFDLGIKSNEIGTYDQHLIRDFKAQELLDGQIVNSFGCNDMSTPSRSCSDLEFAEINIIKNDGSGGFLEGDFNIEFMQTVPDTIFKSYVGEFRIRNL